MKTSSRKTAEQRMADHFAADPQPSNVISLAAALGITYTHASLTARLLVAKGILVRSLGEDGRTILYGPVPQDVTNV